MKKEKNEIKQLRSTVQSTTKTISRDLQGLMGKWDRNRAKQKCIFLIFRVSIDDVTYIFGSSLHENVNTVEGLHILYCT